MFAFALGVAAGCADDRAPQSKSDQPGSIVWDSVVGADRYKVRAWSGYRLLFEETTNDTLLVLTPNLQSTLAAFDSVSVEVRAFSVREPQRALDVTRFAWP